MSSVLILYNKILFGCLCPWKKDLYTSQRYYALLHELKEEFYYAQPLYELDFVKPPGAKCKYYEAITRIKARDFLNWLHNEMQVAFSNSERKYLLGEVFDLLDRKLNRIACIIHETTADINLIVHPERLQYNSDMHQRDYTYILHCIKFQLIRIYLEMQDQYRRFVDREVVSIGDIHQIYFRELMPERLFIIKAPVFFTTSTDHLLNDGTEEKFTPLQRDTRAACSNVLKYHEIVADSARFARMESLLFDKDLIDDTYHFKKMPRGNISRMAAVYRISFQKGYFQKYCFKRKQRVELTAKDVQAFLNYRYHAQINKEFRRFGAVDVLDKFLENEGWINIMDQL